MLRVTIEQGFTKPEYLLDVEKAIQDIKKSKNTRVPLITLGRILSKNLDMNITVDITVNTRNQFFGMNIYPEHSMLNEILDIASGAKKGDIYSAWSKIDTWHIEMDSLLFDKFTSFSASEITAILLHEIGHIMYSNTIPQRINSYIKFNVARMDLKTRALVIKYRLFMLLPLLDVISITNFIPSPTTIGKEVKADAYALKNGYGEELERALEKILLKFGSSNINRPENKIKNEVKTISEWTVANIGQLEFRKTILRTTLKKEFTMNPSKYSKAVMNRISSSLLEGDVEELADTRIVQEQFFIDDFRYACKESTIFDKLGFSKKIRKITPTDINVIRVEIDTIETNDDKLYVLEKANDINDEIDAAIFFAESGKLNKVSQSLASLKILKDDAEKLRSDVLALKVIPKKYGVFIKYPKGFEG